MKLSGITDGAHRVLILQPEGPAPTGQELWLFLCRSVTMLGESYLADTEGTLLSFDSQGQAKCPSDLECQAFGAFLRGGDGTWRAMELPTPEELWALAPGDQSWISVQRTAVR